MTVRIARVIASLALTLGLGGCTNFYEIPIETPIKPKMDVSPFQRVLIAGFVSGGSEDVDTNLETVRLLRSQLRTRSSLQVIDADVLSLVEIAVEQAQAVNDERPDAAPVQQELPSPETIASEEDLEPYERIFANVSFWRTLGQEYQEPLIVTGTVLFTPHSRSGFVTRDREVYDQFGRRQVVPVRTYRDRKGFVLSPKFIFIDGRTGTTLYSESHREEILYEASQNTPALSSYFELMDRLLPTFLSALSTQTIRGTRMLLK